MGDKRSAGWFCDSLPAVRVAPNRVSAINPEVYYSVTCEHPFRSQDLPEGVLLPRLSLYLDARRKLAGRHLSREFGKHLLKLESRSAFFRKIGYHHRFVRS